jgi:hypothetical protein
VDPVIEISSAVVVPHRWRSLRVVPTEGLPYFPPCKPSLQYRDLRSKESSGTSTIIRPLPSLLMRRSALQQSFLVQTLGLTELSPALAPYLKLYQIALQEGLPIDTRGITGRSFNRSQFAEIFTQENYGRVCPLCDGDMNGPEVDYWLPKSMYPALSCHPKISCRFVTALTRGNAKARNLRSPWQISILSTIGFILRKTCPRPFLSQGNWRSGVSGQCRCRPADTSE